MRVELRTEERDRPLGLVVEEREGAPLRLRPERRLDAHAQALERRSSPMPEFVLAECREERAGAGEPRELHCRNCPASPRLLPRLGCMGDLALCGHPLHAGELHPFDMADDGDSHG